MTHRNDVIRYCEHGSLLSQLRAGGNGGSAAGAGPFSTLEGKLRAASEVANGMKQLAAASVVHRDLAARNVLVAGSGWTCKLADFGLSRGFELTRHGYYRSRQGTVALRWAAPEALTEQRFSHASDAWSFGVTLFEIFSDGAQPYKDWNDARVILEVCDLSKPYFLPRPPLMPVAFYHFVAVPTWSFEPRARPSFDALHADLLSGKGITETPGEAAVALAWETSVARSWNSPVVV